MISLKKSLTCIFVFILCMSACTTQPTVVLSPPERITPSATPTLPLPIIIPQAVQITQPPTELATLVSQPTATNIASPTTTPTTPPTYTQTPLIPTATLSTVAQRPTTTPTPWPTIDPAFLQKPPADIDLSQTHLWFTRPVDGNNVPSVAYRYGMTYGQKLPPHRAVDIGNPIGQPVVAVGAGKVYYAGPDANIVLGPRTNFYGQVVILELDQQWQGHTIYALYGHLSTVTVTTEQIVREGDIVGEVGESGIALSPHLHFEIRQDAPENYRDVRNPELWYRPLFNYNGVLAGRVVDGEGRFMPGTLVNIECQDGVPRYVETYWDQNTLPDDILMENFVIGDIPAGECRIWAELFDNIVEDTVFITAGELSAIILQAQN